ncbi:MAG: hypothetical protein VXW65_04900 [Pseudomonadota bacterium]|nr:hypothetical protein [Pseudomonadota bacterium]
MDSIYQKICQSSIHNRVMEGASGELFLATPRRWIEEYVAGERQISQEMLGVFSENLRQRQQLMRALGGAYIHMVAPDKQSVYMRQFVGDDVIRIAEVYQAQQREPFVYPLQDMIAASHQQRVYHLTDFHWNAFGALVGLRAILEALKHPNLHEVIEKWRARIACKSDWSGDLGRLLTPKRQEDAWVFASNKKDRAKIERYSSHCQGMFGKVLLWRHPEALTQQRLLIFADSFLEALLPPLADLYTEVLFVRSHYCHADLVQAYRPDVLLTSSAEGYMCSIHSDQRARPFLDFMQVHCDLSQCDAPLLQYIQDLLTPQTVTSIEPLSTS